MKTRESFETSGSIHIPEGLNAVSTSHVALYTTACHNVSSQADRSSVSTVTPNSRCVVDPQHSVQPSSNVHPAFWRHYANHIHLYEGQETVELYLHNDTEADSEISLLPLTRVCGVHIVISILCSVERRRKQFRLCNVEWQCDY
jgi:hypothetical protein